MGNHGGPWGTVGDRGNQLEPAGTLESQPGVLDDGMQNSALGCMISRLYQCFSFVARLLSPRNDLTPTTGRSRGDARRRKRGATECARESCLVAAAGAAMLPAALPFLGRYGRLRPYFHARIPRTYGGSTAVAPSARTPVFYGRSRVKLRPYLKKFFAGRTGPRKTAAYGRAPAAHYS